MRQRPNPHQMPQIIIRRLRRLTQIKIKVPFSNLRNLRIKSRLGHLNADWPLVGVGEAHPDQNKCPLRVALVRR
jgi:hypothetical protein